MSQRGYLDAQGKWHDLPKGQEVPNLGGSSFFETIAEKVTGGSGLTMSLRTQVSPDFTVDLSTIGRKDRPPQTAQGQGFDWLMRFAKPEVEVSIQGQKRIIAPWGRPTKKYTVIASVVVGVGLIAVGYGVFSVVRDTKKAFREKLR